MFISFGYLPCKQSFSRLHSMSKDGMSKDGRKMSPMHVTLKAVVRSIEFVQQKHVPVKVVLLIVVLDPYYF